MIVTAILSSTLSVLGIISWLHPKIYKMTSVYNEWSDFKVRLTKLEKMVKETHYDTRPNHGGSAYDAQTRLLSSIMEKLERIENNG